MNRPPSVPPQQQERQPGHEVQMEPAPEVIRDDYRGAGKLAGKIAFVSGGDSGIGRSVAVHYAREGADVAIAYLDEDNDAAETARMVEAEGRQCLPIRADLSQKPECERAVAEAVARFGRIDVLVHSIAQQYVQDAPEDISPEQLQRTFQTNVFSYFFLTQAALPHMGEGSAIIYTGSVTGARGKTQLMDYASTKGAIQTLTFSMAQKLAERGIRVNLVAPGPIWTPLIPSSFSPEQVESFGKSTLMGRPGQPSELGPAYVFLASKDASYMTGQILHINGGSFIGT
jgi:NAD(P)-dependent dehydrogenase (short-subunit alcohol dehydrogenase family)